MCETIGERLKVARERAGLDLRTLAARAGVGFNTIAAIEKGKQAPVIRTVELLANALGVEPSWLAFGHRCDLPENSR